jgi:hypothetical protein
MIYEIALRDVLDDPVQVAGTSALRTARHGEKLGERVDKHPQLLQAR